jgi:hypothetical protein
MLHATENFFDLSCADVVVEELERSAIPECAVGSAQPLSGFFFVPESGRCLGADAREP